VTLLKIQDDWGLAAIFATIGAIVFVTNKKAEEK